MAELTRAKEPATAEPIDKLYMENNLLRIAGALFCHDPKRTAGRRAEIEVNKGAVEKSIAIRPDPEFGQPGPLAHKIFVALIKKHSDYGRPIQHEVSFTKRELMRLAGRKDWGGADSEQLSRALMQIQTTLIRAHFKDHSGAHIEERFHIFSKARIERREFASDPIESCTVTLAEPIITSLQDEHFTCLNHGLMMRLGTIGQALYMRLFFHFANRYDGRSRNQLGFAKRYDDICTEWLGGLTVVAHRSKIIDRLGPHLDQLTGESFLASYAITKAKTQGGFVITFRPGAAFFQDYDRFYRHRSQGELQWAFDADRRGIGEPLKVAYLFAEKRTGHPVASVAFVPTKDVATAKELLTHLTFDAIGEFFDYALAEARATDFPVQSLGGIKQYLAAYLARRSRLKTGKAAEPVYKSRDNEAAERSAYDADRRAAALDLFATLPAPEQTDIEAQARAYAKSFPGSLGERMFTYRKAQLIAQRHGAGLKTIEQWRAGRQAA